MDVLNQNQIQPNSESTLRQNLKIEFRDEDYRYGYAESFLNTKLASQIRTIRLQRELTQAEVANLMGIKQSGYARFEDVNHSVWKTDSLWNIARALDVRVNISLETFGDLIDEKVHFDSQHLQRPKFEDDPAFRNGQARTKRKTRCILSGKLPQRTTRRRKNLTEINRKPVGREFPAAPAELAIGLSPEKGASMSFDRSANSNAISPVYVGVNGSGNGVYSHGK